MSAQLTVLKRHPETVWLNEVSSVTLQQELRHLARAFINFFEGRSGYPQCHKKHGKQSATYAASAFQWDGQHVTLAKMSAPLNIRWSRRFYGVPSSVTVSKDGAERYHISVLVDEAVPQDPKNATRVGLDLGVTDAVILSTGQKFGNPRFFRQDETRLAQAQSRLAKKQKTPRTARKRVSTWRVFTLRLPIVVGIFCTKSAHDSFMKTQ